MEIPDTKYLQVTTRSLDSASEVAIHEVQLARPEKRNALPMETICVLSELFESVKPDDGSAIVITAFGEDFSLGADISDLNPAELSDPATLAEQAQSLVASLRDCPLPVVVGVQGRAYGAGFLICLGADLVVASNDATFAIPEASLGIPVAGFTTTLLPQLVGERRAREWLFTGADIGAKEAAAAGFVTETAPPDNLDASLNSLLKNIGESSSTAITALKAQLAPVGTPTREQIQADEQAAMRLAYEDGDASKRIQQLL
ncbi:enoyl-CoA hydratase/isomerase family protein [Halobacterium sp. KA-6]|jgi:enoyl-CoA hydratase/carnithine racemase|uniref:enoyl-CoA hydratase/isomerase family protein n=1 Tax=Halobacterium sp. KA-6 TaxID=2896368 RepID=UPI001E60E8A8|nr:enoyl-CoA hydratase/isomerase family protein [Halobacterium sp. KA-6]MCD2203387.1 enoyl-CoA hydratase/isomerase family protein [Halobacterium sp. KA-6]